MAGISKKDKSETVLNETLVDYHKFLMGGEVSGQARDWVELLAENALYLSTGIIALRMTGTVRRYRNKRDSHEDPEDQTLLYGLRRANIDALKAIKALGLEVSILGFNINPFAPLAKLATPMIHALEGHVPAIWERKDKLDINTWKWIVSPNEDRVRQAGIDGEVIVLDGAWEPLDLEDRLLISITLPTLMKTLVEVATSRGPL